MKWLKTNGNEIETNDREATIEYCESLGWEQLESGESKTSEKDELEKYAKEMFDVDIDKRKSVKSLKAEIKALEDEHGN